MWRPLLAPPTFTFHSDDTELLFHHLCALKKKRKKRKSCQHSSLNCPSFTFLWNKQEAGMLCLNLFDTTLATDFQNCVFSFFSEEVKWAKKKSEREKLNFCTTLKKVPLLEQNILNTPISRQTPSVCRFHLVQNRCNSIRSFFRNRNVCQTWV